MPLFSGKSLPGKVSWQGQQLLLGETIDWASVGGAMNTGVDALAPSMGLAIEIVEIRESDPSP
jgi:hypothetical protein